MPKYFKCLSNLANFNLLFLHFKVYHANNITFYKCLEDNCLRSFSSLNSFKKHVKSHTNNSPILHDFNNISNNNDFELPDSTIINVVNDNVLNESINIETYNSDGNYESFINNKAVELLSKWYNESGFPRNKVQSIINDITKFLNEIVPPLKTEVVSNFEETGDSITNLIVKFNILCDPFKNLNTEHKRFKAFHSLGTFIKPLGTVVGYRTYDFLQRGDVIIKSIPIKIYSVPLEKLFRQFFEIPNVYNIFSNYSETILKENDNLIHNFIQSKI